MDSCNIPTYLKAVVVCGLGQSGLKVVVLVMV